MPDTLIDAVGAVAADVGRMAHRRFAGAYRSWDKTSGKGAGTPVCEVDLEADAMLRERLVAIDPGAGWLSEETIDSAERLLRSRTWVVDPIDGTRDFVRGRTGWCVSIALVEGGSALVGVLDAPALGQQWCAAAGRGATLNGAPIHCAARTTLTGARVPAETLPKVDADLVPVPRPNSIALRIAMVANGEADLLASFRWGNEWDIAAAALIAQEAGATVTDARGQTIRYNSTKGETFGVLATVPGIHAAAVARLSGRAAAALGR